MGDNMITDTEVFATLADLEKIGIQYKSSRQYLDEGEPGEYRVYTYTVYCADGSTWGYSSEDEIFTKK